MKPTVVLVNGAWANNASWSGVIERLQAEGYTVDAPPNPLQSLNGDAATIADFLKTISGPIVLVGHSYGGAVITNAATGNRNVKALVYVDAFAPAKGESVLGLDSSSPGRRWERARRRSLTSCRSPGPRRATPCSTSSRRCSSRRSRTGSRQRRVPSWPPRSRPSAYSAVTAPSGTPAWKTIPSWYVLGTIDKAIPPAIQLFMARADSRPHHQGQGRASLDGGRSRSGREGDHGRGEGNELTPTRPWQR